MTSRSDSVRQATITYHSCNIVLEVNVHIEGIGERREIVLAKLPDELLYDKHNEAEQYVLPFVAAVQHGDERAIAEVARALRAKMDGDEKGSYYDPRGFDRDEWLPKLLCRVGQCGHSVVANSTFCPNHAKAYAECPCGHLASDHMSEEDAGGCLPTCQCQLSVEEVTASQASSGAGAPGTTQHRR